jgi:ribonuclease P protein component
LKRYSLYKSISRFDKREIETLFSIAKKTAYSLMWDIRFAKAETQPGRILIIASKKVGTAPQRNKIKRQIKSIFYEEKLYQLGYTFICIVKRPLIEKSFDFIRKNLLEVINHGITQKIA